MCGFCPPGAPTLDEEDHDRQQEDREDRSDQNHRPRDGEALVTVDLRERRFDTRLVLVVDESLRDAVRDP
jgi:hypothetical protein